MKKILGIFGLLVFVCLFTSILNPDFVTTYNIQNTLRRTSYYGIISIGAAFVIITGGIDLSIGSVIGLIGCLLSLSLAAMGALPPGEALDRTFLLTGLLVWVIGATWLHTLPFREGVRRGLICILFPPAMLLFISHHWRDCRRPVFVYAAGLATVLVGFLMPAVPLPRAVSTLLVVLWMIEISVMMGLIHGFLITRAGLQPFIVTLCGLLIYRGLARWVTNDQTQGFGRSHEELRSLATGRPCTMSALIAAVGLGLIVWALVRWLSRQRPKMGLAPGHGRPVPVPFSEPPQTVSPWCLAAIGGAALSVGVLHYLQDTGSLPRGQATWAQQAMFIGGGIGFAVGLIWLNAVALLRRRWKMLAADAVAAAGCVVLGMVLYRPQAASSGAMDSWFWAAATVLGLSAAIGGAGYLLQGLWREAELGVRSWVAWTIAAGVFLMTGLTPMDRVEVPMPLLIMISLALLAGGFLNYTVYGRHLLALGRNEEAARYSGINTGAMVITAYVICAVMAGIAGILFSLDVNSLQPSGHGSFYELYAIAAAVLGGCSLRGGEGSILGVVIGAAIMQVLYNAINILGISTQLEFAIIGGVILAGVAVDELLRRMAEEQDAGKSSPS
jgi:ribose/xylose/arabinose/galactoside ABC-type transport system permease subunit